MEENELTQEQLEQAKNNIRNGLPADGIDDNGEDEDIRLPSDGEEEPRVYANNFKNVDELKKGIANLGSNLPEYVLNGMNDDALEQHYIELRKEFSSRGQEKKQEQNKNTDKPSDKISDELWTSIENQFAESGYITDEQRTELKKVGYTDKMIDNYIDGVNAKKQIDSIKQEQFTKNIYDLAGGKEQYEVIKAWAEENYTQEELNAVASGTYDEIYFKMKGIKADYIEQNGNVSIDRLRGSTANRSSESYKSQKDYLLDRMDMRYKTDRKYKEKVDSRFKNSTFAS